MESISSCVKQIIDKTPFLHESMVRGIISFTNLADSIKSEIEGILGKEVKQSAIVMALRRYSEELQNRNIEDLDYHVKYEIVMKTNIFDVNLVKRQSLLDKLKNLYHIVSIDKGDFLNVTIGNNEISIAVSQKYRKDVDLLLAGETVLHRESDLVALTVIFTGDFLNTPGIVYEAVKKLAWEHINVYEIVSTMNELTFVIPREDSIHAFEAMQFFLGK